MHLVKAAYQYLCCLQIRPMSVFVLQLFNYQTADDTIFVFKFSKKMSSPSYYHIENSKTRGQIV